MCPRHQTATTWHDTTHGLLRALSIVLCSCSRTVCASNTEVEGKVLEADSLVGLGACQLQWEELRSRGIELLSAPKQVRSAFAVV